MDKINTVNLADALGLAETWARQAGHDIGDDAKWLPWRKHAVKLSCDCKKAPHHSAVVKYKPIWHDGKDGSMALEATSIKVTPV